MTESPPLRGLFIGLTTLDLIYHAESAPKPNEKVVAKSMTFAAGGPATNAAIAFAALGGEATLLSVVGQHALSQWIQDDLVQHQVHHIELMPLREEPPTVSSIVVSQGTGDRAIISKNADGYQFSPDVTLPLTHDELRSFDVILFDGHQMALSQAIAVQARALGIPTVFDGGSWKPGSEILLPQISHILCSESFTPQSCGNESETLDYLRALTQTANLAITHGADPILLAEASTSASAPEITYFPCPLIQAVDTLGAGDFFHGAFAYFVTQMPFPKSIQQASAIASFSCQFPGTRDWLSKMS